MGNNQQRAGYFPVLGNVEQGWPGAFGKIPETLAARWPEIRQISSPGLVCAGEARLYLGNRQAFPVAQMYFPKSLNPVDILPGPAAHQHGGMHSPAQGRGVNPGKADRGKLSCQALCLP